MIAIKFIVGLLFVFFAITFAMHNQQEIVISYYGEYSVTLNLWVSLLVSLGFGALLIGLGNAFTIIKLKKKNWNLKRRVSKLENEISELKEYQVSNGSEKYPE
tara:strand:+ start:199269 stop:199577 length:309 start_codon:yes stop_codon:yes gene_type:complete